MVRGAMRIAARFGIGVGKRVGDLRARCQLGRAAAMSRIGRPCRGAHVPAEGGVQIAGGLQMFGDQRRVLLGRCRVT